MLLVILNEEPESNVLFLSAYHRDCGKFYYFFVNSGLSARYQSGKFVMQQKPTLQDCAIGIQAMDVSLASTGFKNIALYFNVR